jgi:hypothetical protein
MDSTAKVSSSTIPMQIEVVVVAKALQYNYLVNLFIVSRT